MHPINRITADVVSMMRLQANKKEIALNFTPLAKETHVALDLVSTQQILINFVANAIRFSQKGSEIKILVDIQSKKKGKEVDVSISVQDRGIGMTQAEQRAIFEPFSH